MLKAQIVKLSSSHVHLDSVQTKIIKCLLVASHTFPVCVCIIYFHLKNADGLHVYYLKCRACFYSTYVHLKLDNFIACLWKVLKSVYPDLYWWIFRWSLF